MKIFEMLAEQRIAEAQRRGDFDNLPGRGKPLRLDDEPFVSEEQRMLNRIMKNAGLAPAEVGLRRELAGLRAELEKLPEGPQRARLKHRIALAAMELAELSRRQR